MSHIGTEFSPFGINGYLRWLKFQSGRVHLGYSVEARIPVHVLSGHRSDTGRQVRSSGLAAALLPYPLKEGTIHRIPCHTSGSNQGKNGEGKYNAICCCSADDFHRSY